jgi:hypothetical protein
MPALSVQIAIETTSRCGGSCQGCALTSEERHDPKDVNIGQIKEQLSAAKEWLEKMLEESRLPLEAVSLFFGQGDHFLLKERELVDLAEAVGNVWPEKWKAKTVLLLTASAVTNPDALRGRSLRFRESCLKSGINGFVQVVFDPKKWTSVPNFKEQYLENILFLRKTFEMVELTVNLASDVVECMSASEFHQWLLRHNFKHVEFNWASQPELQKMWEKGLPLVWAWLRRLTDLAWASRQYDINYVPWTMRRLEQLERGEPNLDERAVLFGADGVQRWAEVGPIGNVTPWVARTVPIVKEESRERIAKERWFATQSACLQCKFKPLCKDAGVYGWAKHMPKASEVGCPWMLDEWWSHLEELGKVAPWKAMRFDKNPTPSEMAIRDRSQQYADYFLKSKKREQEAVKQS